MDNNQVDYLNMFIITFFSVLPLVHHIVEASRGIEHVWKHSGRKGKFQLYKGECIVGDIVTVDNSLLKSEAEVVNVYKSSGDREHMIESDTNICPGDGCLVKPLFWYSTGAARYMWVMLSLVVMFIGSNIKVTSTIGDTRYYRHCYVSLFLCLFFLQGYKGEHQNSTITNIKDAFIERLVAAAGTMESAVDRLDSVPTQELGRDMQR